MRFPGVGWKSALWIILLSLSAPLVSQDPAPQVSQETPKSEPAVVPSARPVAGEILLETVGSRETVPPSTRENLRLPAGKDGKRSLTWGLNGEKRAALGDMLLLKFPLESDSQPQAPFSLFLRDGTELLGSIVPPPAGAETSADVLFFSVPLLSKDPLKVSLDHVKGLLIHVATPANVATPAAAPSSPRSPAATPTKNASPPVSRTPARRAALASRSQGAVKLRNEVLRSAPPKDMLIFLEEGRAQGVLDSLSPQGAHFGSQSLGDVRVGFDKLRAVILAEIDGGKKAVPDGPPGPSGPGLVRVLLGDGSAVQGMLDEIQAGVLTLDSPSLGTFHLPLKYMLEIAFLGGRLSYLSDREPSRVDERLPVAFTANPRPHQRDLNVLEGPLRMGGNEYRKGLGVHAYSLLEYDLAGTYSRFQATIGLDECARPTGSRITGTEGAVVFRARLDGKPLFEKPMTWRDPPEAVDLSVAGGKTLSLEVLCGKPDDVASVFNFALDRADWAEARVIQ